jgi:hypothetical protein
VFQRSIVPTRGACRKVGWGRPKRRCKALEPSDRRICCSGEEQPLLLRQKRRRNEEVEGEPNMRRLKPNNLRIYFPLQQNVSTLVQLFKFHSCVTKRSRGSGLIPPARVEARRGGGGVRGACVYESSSHECIISRTPPLRRSNSL